MPGCRVLREHGWIAISEELGLELLDCGVSKAFALADHKVAHIYVKDTAILPQVREVLAAVPGVESVIDGVWKASIGLDHPRSGDLICLADKDGWFTYYYWLDDALAPDFARCVDIHRKQGYDPVELFIDPMLKHPKFEVGKRLLMKKAGMRYLMDVIPLDGVRPWNHVAIQVRLLFGRRPNSRSFSKRCWWI